MPDPTNSPGAGGSSRADLEAEIVRLRDLLIARDTELGAAKGRLKIIDDHGERMTRMIQKLRIPGLAWILGAVQRALLSGGGS